MPTIATLIALVVTRLRTAIGAQQDRQARPPQPVWLGRQVFVPRLPPERLPRLSIDAWTLAWHRLQRLSARFQALFDRFQAGTLPRPRPKRARPAPASAPAPTPAPARPRAPRAFGWLNRRIPESAPPSGQLEALLHAREAELRAFLAAAPQAGRLLRPLCQALGVRQPDWLRLPPRPRAARPARPPRARRPRLTDPTLRLPRYIIDAARASKKRYGPD